MKTSNLFTLVAIALVAGCASSPPQNNPEPSPVVAPSASADLLIISAVYGSGTHFADVTYRVDDLLHQPAVEFFARPEWLGADPTPGWNKVLVIVYEYNGRRHTFTTGEGGEVSSEQLIKAAKKRPERKMRPRTHIEPTGSGPSAAVKMQIVFNS